MKPEPKPDDLIRARVEEAAWAVAEPHLGAIDFELVDVEYRREPVGTVLRLFIDKEGGVRLDDCQEASRLLEPVFESEGIDEMIPGRYSLEVSSPGLFRPIKRMRDYERAVGRRIKLRTRRPLEGQRTFVGHLVRLGEGHLFLRVDESAFEIEFDNIVKANFEPELNF